VKQGQLLTRLALLGVPQHLRDSVQGDLQEQQAGPREALAIALQFQAEPYRCASHRRAALLMCCAAAALLAALPLAAHGLLAQAGVFTDGFSRAALRIWEAPALLAAGACGLWLGRAPLLPPHADALRLHALLLLAPVAALAAPGVAQAALSAALMPAAAWLAHRSRAAAPDPGAPA
jgi:hypothetical protein